MKLSLPSLPEPARPVDRHRDETLAHTHDIARRFAAQAAEPFADRRVDGVLRMLDVVLAATILIVFAPFIALAVVAVLATSGRPVLYRGLRVGRAGELFTIYKLRTLRPDAEARLGPFQDKELDRRTEDETTRVGQVLRATQLDELPSSTTSCGATCRSWDRGRSGPCSSRSWSSTSRSTGSAWSSGPA